MVMLSRILTSLSLGAALLGSPAAMAAETEPGSIRDLPYGNALYHYFLDRPLTAITRLLAAKERNRLQRQGSDPDLLLGNLYYGYGLIPDAVDLFNALLDDNSPQDLRNRVWFNLARVEYDQGNYAEAADLLQRLQGELPERREAQKDYLLTRLLLRARNLDGARDSLKRIPDDSIWRDYAEYNLGIALVAEGKPDAGRSWLLSAADRSAASVEPERQALGDAARLAAGLAALRDGQWGQAVDDLRLVHVDGPLSNTALLASAWAWHNQGNPLQATGMMQAVIDKGQKDPATRESYIAMGQVQEQSGNLKLSAWYYDRAARYLQDALDEIDRVIAEVEQGELIQTLLDQGQIRTRGRDSLERPPPSQASPYLIEAMADDAFQRQVRNLQQLIDIRDQLLDWRQKIPTFELMLEERQRAFDARKPLVEQSTDLARLQDLHEQRRRFADEVERIGREQDASALANEDEADYLEQLDEIRELMAELRGSQDLGEAENKYRLMNGLLIWDLETAFPPRYWALQRELQLLDRALAEADRAAESLRGASARHQLDLTDLSQRIDGQDAVIAARLADTQRLIDEQQKAINDLVIEQLRQLRRHTQQLRLSARYSVARLYDKLTEQQKPGGVE